MSSQQDLATRLVHGPAILLLGQNYLKLESGEDLFLTGIMKKFDGSVASSAFYDDLLSSSAQTAPENALAWMHTLSDRLSIPAWLQTVSEFAWSSVFSSAIDTIWSRALRKEWRDIYPVYSSDVNPLEQRSRTMLHTTFLYGSITQSESDYRSPLNRREYLRRKQVATFLASRIPEVVSPFGTLIIEGYVGKRDWLSPEDLVPVLDSLNVGQTHIFHADETLLEDEDIADFVQSGKIIIHNEGLAEFLLQCADAGYLSLGPGPATFDQSRRISIASKPFEVPLDLWNQTRRSCTIVDSTTISEPSVLSDERNYQEYRRFLAESGIKPVWTGYARGYAFARDYEVKLYNEVDKQSRTSELQEEPIILYGPSGTGKTVALGALAYRICKEGYLPTLFIERRPQRPNYYDIDAFCKWAEDNGATATVIVWDGMVEAYQYFELLRYLTGRGRKAVLVGSAYRESNPSDTSLRSNYISASQKLDDDEIEPFKTYLNQFDPSLGSLLSNWMDETFLVALYRLLPSTRAGLRTGLLSEVGYAEALMARHAQSNDVIPRTSLGLALLDAGLLDVEELLNEKRKIGSDDMATPQEVTGLVMVPGRYGLKVPLDLLIRAIDMQWLENIERIIRVDLFNINEDEHGNITVSARHPKEAEIICQSRFGTAQQEVAFAENLIQVMRDDDFSDEGQEVQFVVDLVRNMGPNGPASQYFSPHFLKLSGALGALRTERSIQVPRLMLQEAVLIREYVVSRIRTGFTPDDAVELLDRAEKALRQSLQILDTSRRSSKFRSVVLVELGTMQATRTRYQLDQSIGGSVSMALYNQARESLIEARTLAPSDYHSVDVMLWLGQYLFESDELNAQQKAEILADIRYLLFEVNPEDFDLEQRNMYQQRRMKVANSTSDEGLSEQAFEALVAQGSSAGYFLRALEITKDYPQNTVYDESEMKCFGRAAEYLEENRAAISNDGRCMFLLLRTWWGAKVGQPMFLTERQTVPFEDVDWRYLIGILEDLLGTNEGHENPSIYYLLGFALFHVQQIEKAFQVFADLERESDIVRGRRRVVRSYLASQPNGDPWVFHGSVSWVDNNRNRGQLQVEELRRVIRFLPMDFRNDLQRGDAIGGGFHISFNFIGPLADPKRYYKNQAKKDV